MNIIFIGPPGSGKSTQAETVAEELGLLHVSTGGVIRRLHEQGDPAVEEIYEYVLRGEWVPDNLIIDLLSSWLDRFPEAEGVVLDGFPRTVNQAEVLKAGDILPGSGRVDKVIYVNTSREECLRRLKKRAKIEHREDETVEGINQRLEEFDQKTRPVLDYYRDRGLLEEVDGDPSIKEIRREIMALFRNPAV